MLSWGMPLAYPRSGRPRLAKTERPDYRGNVIICLSSLLGDNRRHCVLIFARDVAFVLLCSVLIMMTDLIKIQLTSKAAEVKSSVGLTNTQIDRDRWRDFLVGHFSHDGSLFWLAQRISKAIHDRLDSEPISWSELSWDFKENARVSVENQCREKNVFDPCQDISFAVNWRLHQLQKSKHAKKVETRPSSTGQIQGDDHQQTPFTNHSSRPYDPVKDLT
jgi:hypothetical protein